MRHNLACSMIFKAISETGSLGCCFVCMDIGSSRRLATSHSMQILQIPGTAEFRILPKSLFPPRFSDKNRFTSSRPDAVLGAPSLQKQKRNRLVMKGGGFLGVAGGNQGTPGAPQQHRQPLADPPSPDSIDPKILAFFNVTFTSSRSNTLRTLDRRIS